MIAVLFLGAMVVGGFRWPGLLIAGAIFTYQVGALSDVQAITPLYTLAALGVALFLAQANLFSFRFNTLDLVFVAFLGFYCLTAAYAPSPQAAVNDIQRLLVTAVSMFALGRLCAMVESPERLAIQLASGLLLFGSVFAVMLMQDSAASAAMRLQVGDATAVGASQPFPLALTAGIIAMIATLVQRRWWMFVLSAAATAILLYVSVLSGTRGVFVALILTIVVMWILSATKGKVWLAIAAVALASALFSPLLSVFGEESLFQSGLDRILRNFQDDGFASDLSGRIRLGQQMLGLELWSNNPWFGVGLSGYQTITGEIYPHNVLIEVASQSGTVGLLIFMFYVGMVARRLLALPEFGVRVLFAGLLTAAFLHMQLSFALYMAKPLFLLTGVAAAWSINVVRARRPGGIQKRSPSSLSATHRATL